VSDEGQEVVLALPVEVQPAPPPLWPVIVGFIMAEGAALIAGSFLVAVAFGWKQASGAEVDLAALPLEPWILVGSGAISVSAFGAFALLSPRIAGEPWGAGLRTGPSGASGLELVLGTLAVVSVGSAVGSATWLLGWYQTSSLSAMDAAVPSYPLPAFIVLLVLGTVGAGVAEELFFRGFIQSRLALRYGRWSAILVTSALFGLVHFDPVHVLLTAPMGVALGWMTELRGSVRPAIFAHVANNLIAFLSMRFLPTYPEAQAALLALWLGAGALALGGLLIIHHRALFRRT
jgi:uncharacterized protein